MASLLEQLKSMTTIVADTGEVEAIKTLKPQDATTNPSLLLKASTLPQCEPMITEAIAYAKSNSSDKNQQIEDAVDKLAVLVGLEIQKHIP
jgi:transaldolase